MWRNLFHDGEESMLRLFQITLGGKISGPNGKENVIPKITATRFVGLEMTFSF
jgi:hypothetical protein